MKKSSRFIFALLFVLAGIFVGLVISSNFGRQQTASAGAIEERAPRSVEEQETIDIYRRASEAVVFITTTTLTVDPYDIFMEVQPREGTGSGIVIDSTRGIIVTNLHVIQDAHKIEISLSNGQNYRAKLVGYDDESDIAVLQIPNPPSGLKSLMFGDSSQLEVGQRVLAIGNPFGLNRTLTSGIISSLDRVVKSPSGKFMRGLIQTDASINPGNSGGPLIDMSGRLIGINSAILSQSGDSAGIGFAVPSNLVKRILPELIATGKVLRPKFGWVLVDTTQGPMVRRLAPGGPADKAGLQPLERRVEDIFLQGYVRDFDRADLIVKVNGQAVRSKDEVDDILARAGTGEIVLLVRQGGLDGREREVKIKPSLQ
ncbi:MAG: trypsin-like peptidase domain-containing protein [Oligoflexia bacterium]|nr:trypsin-like peptidase domain-containing protein [Oligoflexia bacterium]